MDDEFKDLQRLLNLKRHETPPPEYFEDFLWEFQRRQRAEMLKRPLWRLALDRFEGALPNFSLARTTYRGASAMAVMVAVVVSGRIMIMPRTAVAPSLQASVKVGRVPLMPPPSGVTVVSASPKFDFYSTKRQFRLPETDFDRPHATAASFAKGTRPRYVLDTQPVSYEQPFSF